MEQRLCIANLFRKCLSFLPVYASLAFLCFSVSAKAQPFEYLLRSNDNDRFAGVLPYTDSSFLLVGQRQNELDQFFIQVVGSDNLLKKEIIINGPGGSLIPTGLFRSHNHYLIAFQGTAFSKGTNTMDAGLIQLDSCLNVVETVVIYSDIESGHSVVYDLALGEQNQLYFSFQGVKDDYTSDFVTIFQTNEALDSIRIGTSITRNFRGKIWYRGGSLYLSGSHYVRKDTVEFQQKLGIVKFSTALEPQWYKVHKRYEVGDYGFLRAALGDGNLSVLYTSQSSSGMANPWIFNMDTAGRLLDSFSLPGDVNKSYPESIIRLHDGNYIVTIQNEYKNSRWYAEWYKTNSAFAKISPSLFMFKPDSGNTSIFRSNIQGLSELANKSVMIYGSTLSDTSKAYDAFCYLYDSSMSRLSRTGLVQNWSKCESTDTFITHQLVPDNYFRIDSVTFHEMLDPEEFILSTSPVEAIYTLAVYPNPATNTITVSGLPTGISPNIKAVVFNSGGQEVKQSHYLFSEEIEMDISSLPKGIYFLLLTGDLFSARQIFIKE